jgi:methylisocitrate lyase
MERKLTMSTGKQLRDLMERAVPPVIPLVLDPLSARYAAAAGFEALYLGGGTLGYQKAVTEANLTLTQVAQAGIEIRAAAPLPLILDGACGWGEPVHMHNTMRMVEAAGFAGIEVEDQLYPKRLHHHIDVERMIPMEEMVQKIEELVAARRDPNFVIIARTNACRNSSDDFDEAVRRAEAYRRAGADMLLVLPKNPEQARAIGERVEGPLFYLMLGGIESIGMSLEELGALGYKLIVDPLTPFYSAARALRLTYEALARGEADPTVSGAFKEETEHVHSAIGLETLLAVERRTTEKR